MRRIVIFIFALAIPVTARATPCDFEKATNSDDVTTRQNEAAVAVKRLFDGGCVLARPDADALLRREAEGDDTEVAGLLIARGHADVDGADREGSTPLHHAATIKSTRDTARCQRGPTPDDCWAGNTRMVKFFLARGANPNLQNKYGVAPIHLAIADDVPDVAWLLAHAKGAGLSLADNNGYTPLHLAARKASLPLVRYLLSRGVDRSPPDADGNTPLHEVSRTDFSRPIEAYVEVARLLAAKGGKLAAQNADGETPLHEAATFGNDGCKSSPALGRFLVLAGAPSDSRDNAGRTPLHHAAAVGNADLVALLLEKGADAKAKDKDGFTPLHWLGAFARPCVPLTEPWRRTVALLTKAGARFQDVDAAGRTPLWLAITGGRTEVVDLFLASGATATELGPRRATPLHLAAYLDEGWVAERLLKDGASLNPRDDGGRTPLHWAATTGSARTVAFLVDRGADASPIDTSGRTPLDLATIGCQEQTSQVLLRVGARRGSADVRPAVGPCAKSPAHPVDGRLEKAARAYQTGELKALVLAGVPVDSRDEHGRTPLHLVAAHFYLKDELGLLLGRKADPNARDDEGMTPLHVAAEDGRAEMSRLLLAAGADPNSPDARGRTPLHLVPYRNDVHDLTALLIDKGAIPGKTDRLGRTALHAMSDGKAEDRARAEFLVCHGADPGARDLLGWTASDLAAIRGWPDAGPARCGDAWQRLMLRRKADPDRPRLGY